MNETLKVALIALGSAAGVGVISLIALHPLRKRSLRASLLAIPITAVLAVVVAVLANARAMFLSAHDAGVVLIVCAVAGVAATAVTIMLGRHVVASSRMIQEALRVLGEEGQGVGLNRRIGTSGPAEFAALSQQLADTTERLAQSREHERSLEAARRELVAWVSHDLRTPLASLRAMSEALEDGVAEDPNAYLRQMRISADRLSTMVDDLFELARVHATGGRTDGRRDVPLRELLDQTKAAVQGLADAGEVGVLVREMSDVAIHGDEQELVRVLTNLVGNGIRHSPPGTSVVISTSVRDERTAIEVADSCGGIPLEHLERVFDIGWRASEARTPGDGAGLGLAIAQAIAHSHDGSLDVRNVDGGCVFRLSLPITAKNSSDERETQ